MEEKTELFEKMPIRKAVLKLSLPTVLASLVGILYNIADTYFVGMLNRPAENAAVTLAGSVTLAFCAVTNLFGVGTSSLLSRALGVKDYETVKKGSAFGFYSALFFSVLFSLMCWIFMDPLLSLLGADSTTYEVTKAYLKWTVVFGAVPSIMHVVISFFIRAEGEAMHSSVGMMSGCIMNIILDPFFILPWGLDMGAEGAGIATFLSNCFSMVYFLLFLFNKRGRTFVCINPKKIRFRKNIIFDICNVGIPASIQNLLNVTGMTILNAAAASYGASAVAAMGIAQRIHSIPMQITMGLPQGAMPLVGYNYANGNRKRMKSSISFVCKLMAAVLALPVILGIIFPQFFMSLFIDNQEIIESGGKLLRGLCVAIPLHCADFLAVNVFQAVGQGQKSLLFAIVRKIVLEIPAIFIFNHLFPFYGLAMAQPAAEIVMALMAVVMVRKIVNGPA